MKNKSFILVILGLLVVVFIVWQAFNKPKDSELDGKTDINLQLQWFDGAQFCGLYVAQSKGYFLEEGLNVNINPLPSFTSDPIAILTDGDADIAISTADQVLINKDAGKEIKAFGTVFNRNLACYVYKYDTMNTDNIDELFKDKKIAVYKKFDTENVLLSLIQKNDWNIDEQNIIQAPQAALEALELNEIGFLGSYIINEPIRLNLNNVNVKYIDPTEFGVHFYSDTYIAKSDAWQDPSIKINEEVLMKFFRAANKGWQFCKDNQEEALEIMFSMIKNKTKTDDYEMEKAALAKALEYIGEGEDNIIGYMEKKKWLSMEKDLHDIGRIKQTGYIDDLCDFKLIEKTNEKSQ